MLAAHALNCCWCNAQVAAILAIILLDFPDFGLILALLFMNATISYYEEASADQVRSF